MRTALALVLLLALALPLAAAQRPPRGGGATPCDGPGFGGFGGGGPPNNGGFNGTPRNGTSGSGTRADRNGTFGGRGQNGIAELNVTFEPAGPLTIAPGATAAVVATLANSGASTLHLDLSTGGRPNATQAPQNVSAALDLASIAIGPGGSARATLTIRVDPATPEGCVASVGFLAREVGTNRTSNARLVVDVPAAVASTPEDPAPAAAATAAVSPASEAQRTTPGASLAFALAMLAAAAIHKRRPS